MLSRFWEGEGIQEKKKRIKKHKTEFIAFLEKKYGKEYYNKIISESEVKRDIDEFEKYRKTQILKEKNLKHIEKELKNTLKQKVKTTNLQKYKIKPKRAPVTVWLLNSSSKPDEEIKEEDYNFAEEEAEEKDWVLLNPRKDDIEGIKKAEAFRANLLKLKQQKKQKKLKPKRGTARFCAV